MQTDYKWLETKSAAYGEAVMLLIGGAVFSYLQPTMGIPILVGLFCIGCFLIWKAYSKQSIGIPVLMIVSYVLFSLAWQTYSKKPLTFATPDALTPSILQNMNIRISDLTREEQIIRNRTFDNCHIYGPAIIITDNCIITPKADFTEIDPNGIFIETTNKIVSGAIKLDTCVIKNCTFHKISFIGSSEGIRRLKERVINTSK